MARNITFPVFTNFSLAFSVWKGEMVNLELLVFFLKYEMFYINDWTERIEKEDMKGLGEKNQTKFSWNIFIFQT